MKGSDREEKGRRETKEYKGVEAKRIQRKFLEAKKMKGEKNIRKKGKGKENK